ncbi:MAG: hypothetical protein IPJ30_01295 [Acidobacteria bacterium]|nr:hypothetical protein [Acidobacteriota bacterium]
MKFCKGGEFARNIAVADEVKVIETWSIHSLVNGFRVWLHRHVGDYDCVGQMRLLRLARRVRTVQLPEYWSLFFEHRRAGGFANALCCKIWLIGLVWIQRVADSSTASVVVRSESGHFYHP